MAEYVVDLSSVAVKSFSELNDDERWSWLTGLPVREEIVRCRDCKHYSDHEWVQITDVSDVCYFWAGGCKVEPDGFCKWGERTGE